MLSNNRFSTMEAKNVPVPNMKVRVEDLWPERTKPAINQSDLPALGDAQNKFTYQGEGEKQ